MAQAESDEHPAATAADFAERNAPRGTHPSEGGSSTFSADDMLGGAADSVKDSLKGATDSVKGKARELAEAQKAAGAERLSAFGKAIHGAAEQLGKEMPAAAGYIHTAADKLESASSRLQESSVNELIGRFERFARNQPAAAFAGAIVAGFALSRFLKSSSQ